MGSQSCWADCRGHCHMCWSVMNVDQHGKSAISRCCSYPNSIPIRCPAILVGGGGAKKHCKMSRHGCAIGKPCIVSTPCVLPEIPVWSKRLVWWDTLVRRLMDRRVQPVQPPLEASTYCEWWISYCWTCCPCLWSPKKDLWGSLALGLRFAQPPDSPHALHGCCPCCRHFCWRSLWYGSNWGTKWPTESIRQHQLIPIDHVWNVNVTIFWNRSCYNWLTLDSHLQRMWPVTDLNGQWLIRWLWDDFCDLIPAGMTEKPNSWFHQPWRV